MYPAATFEIPSRTPVYFVTELTSSIKNAWDDMQITVSENVVDTNIARQMLKQQEATVRKIWNTPENDQWDELYKDLHA